MSDIQFDQEEVERVARAIHGAKMAGHNPDCLYQHHDHEDWPVDDRREYADPFTGEPRVQLFHKAWRRYESAARAAIAAMNPKPAEADAGWIVGNGNADKWRAMDGTGNWTWSASRDDAVRYARRVDAERAHAEDEDAWRVEPYTATEKAVEPVAWMGERYICTRENGEDIYAAPAASIKRPFSTDRNVFPLYAHPPAADVAEAERQEGLAKTCRQAQLTAEEKLCREQQNAEGWKKRAEYLESQLKAVRAGADTTTCPSPSEALSDTSTSTVAKPADTKAGPSAADISAMREALKRIANPLAALQRDAEAKGRHLSGQAYEIANNVHHLKDIARQALAALPALPEEPSA